jgi:hypothetical protein
MTQLFNLPRSKPITWSVRWRAYPILFFRLFVLYLRSPAFRSLVKFGVRHRRFINMRVLAFGTKGYLLATNSRITISGLGSLVLPQNKARQFAAFGRRTQHYVLRRCAERYMKS